MIIQQENESWHAPNLKQNESFAVTESKSSSNPNLSDISNNTTNNIYQDMNSLDIPNDFNSANIPNDMTIESSTSQIIIQEIEQDNELRELIIFPFMNNEETQSNDIDMQATDIPNIIPEKETNHGMIFYR